MSAGLPFTQEQFFDVFARYNTAVWPAPAVLTALAIATCLFAVRGRNGRAVAACLAAQWAWTGITYHWLFFARVNPAAWLFGALWVGGALAFAANALGARPLCFRSARPLHLAIGGSLVLYALLLYPILGHLVGRAYPRMPSYGAPCPVTIATLGILWVARVPLPKHLVIAPVVWAAVGSFGAFMFGVTEDAGLLAAGLSGLALLVRPAAVGAKVTAARTS